jgi:hypothetical protein
MADTIEHLVKRNYVGSTIFRFPPQLDLSVSYNIAPSQKILAIRSNPKTNHRYLTLCYGA